MTTDNSPTPPRSPWYLSRFASLWFHRTLRYGLVALVAVTALIYWPTACSPVSGAKAPEAARSENTAPAELATPRHAFLPHPAFAFAQGDPASGVSIADIAERVTKSVVSISSEREVEAKQSPFPFPFPFGPPGPQGPHREQGLGSGVIVSEDGVILTNNHLTEGAEDIRVTTQDGREYQAKVVGADAKSDLAVLKLKLGAEKTPTLSPLELGDSSRMRLGDIVLAIGNPFGVGQTVTMGIVSAKGRANVGIVDYEDFIQTDAAINPGNSGGALVNMEGKLIGINTAILSRSGGYQGIGFAIPTNMARPIMDSLIEHGRVVRGYLGVSIQDIDHALAQAMNLQDTNGVLVAGVEPGSAAEKAGIQRGDVIRQVDGIATESAGRLRNLIAGKGSAQVTISLLRDSKPLNLQVKLGELPDTGATSKTPEAESGALGMELAPLTGALRQQFGIESQEGKVVITNVVPGSRAAQAGLRPGDVLLELNRKKITSPAEARQLIKTSKGPLLIVISRQGNSRYLAIPR